VKNPFRPEGQGERSRVNDPEKSEAGSQRVSHQEEDEICQFGKPVSLDPREKKVKVVLEQGRIIAKVV
jgi:hypothetical protein